MKLAPKIHKETCLINWSQTSEEVVNFIRGLSPYPSAWAIFNNKTYKIAKASISLETAVSAPGTLETDNKNYLKVFTSNGSVLVEQLQAEGKKKMLISEFLRGNKF